MSNDGIIFDDENTNAKASAKKISKKEAAQAYINNQRNNLTFDIRQLRGRVSAVDNVSNQNIVDLKELFDNLTKGLAGKNQEAFDVEIETIIVERPGYRIPVLAFVSLIKSEGVAYYTALLPEVLGAPVPSTQVEDQGNRYEVKRVTAEYYDFTPNQNGLGDVTSEDVALALRAKYKKDFQLNLSTVMVIPRWLNLSNPSEVGTFYDAAREANRMIMHSTRGILTSEWAAEDLIDSQRNFYLKVDVKLNPGKTIHQNAHGETTYTDFSIDTVYCLAGGNNGNSQVHNNDTNVTLASATGYVDFAMIDPQPATREGGAEPAFGPYVVLNSTSTANSATTGDRYTRDDLMSHLLAIVSATAMESPNWKEIFTRDGGRYKDLGAFNLRYDPLGYTGRKSKQSMLDVSLINGGEKGKFSPEDVFSVYVVNDTFGVAVDCPLGGAMNYIHNMICSDNPAKIAAVHQEINAWSNGEWYRVAGAGGMVTYNGVQYPALPIIAESPVEILNGRFKGEDGQFYDLRQYGLLEIYQKAQDSLDAMDSFMYAMFPGTCNYKTKAERHSVIKTYLPNVEFTDYVLRYWVNPNFLQAMIQMLQNLGLSLQLEGIDGLRRNIGHHSQLHSAMARASLGSSSVMHRGYSQGVANNNGAYRPRW